MYSNALEGSKNFLKFDSTDHKSATFGALLDSMKEIYGWLLLLALLCLVGLMMRYSDIRPRKVIEPTYRLIHRYIRRDIRRTSSSL